MKFNWYIKRGVIHNLDTPLGNFTVQNINDTNTEFWVDECVSYSKESVEEVKSMLEKFLLKRIEKCKSWMLENNVSSLDDYIENRQKLYWDIEINEDDFEESSKFQREIEISLTSAKHFKRRLE